MLRRGTVQGKLAARNAERDEITSFLSRQLEEAKRGGFLYICGPPGTGKTALMNEIFTEYRDCSSIAMDMAFINCMSFDKPDEVFERIIEEFGGHVPSTEPQLDSFLIKRKTMSLVVLDEMDHLVTKNQEVMYKLVEYANRPNSKFVLIGIANSLNLPDRFLPRLKGKKSEPKRLSFHPYTTEDIVTIISARLQSLDPTSETFAMMDPKAIELCARKVSAASGDLRMALDICRRAIELVESEELTKQENLQKTPLKETILQTLSPSPSPSKRRRVAATANMTTLDITTAPKVTPMHIIKVTASLGSSQSFAQRLKSLPPQHKAILCTLVVMKSNTATLGEVCDKYTRLCRRDGMLDPLPKGDFLDACKQLDGNDMIAIEKTKGKKVIDRNRKVGLSIQEVDVLQAIQGMEMLARFFED